jgi:hypothetical protein
MSIEVFRALIDNNSIDNFTYEDQTMIKNLIKGENYYKNPLEMQDNSKNYNNVRLDF